MADVRPEIALSFTRSSATVLVTEHRIEMRNHYHYAFLIRSSVMEAMALSAQSARL